MKMVKYYGKSITMEMEISTSQLFEKLTEEFPGKPLTVTLVRGQQEMALQLP